MKFPSRDIVERVRKEYPIGTRVKLAKMDDAQAPPIGTKGTVKGVDDTASIKFGAPASQKLVGKRTISEMNELLSLAMKRVMWSL